MAEVATMSDDEFRGHVKSGVISNFVINVVLNGAIGWFLFSGRDVLVPFGGDEAYGPDLLITGFLLSAILSGVIITQHYGKAAKGELGLPGIAAPSWVDAASTWSRWKTCSLAALGGTALSGVLLGVAAWTVGAVSVVAYVAAKSLYCGVLAAAIVAPATLIGLRLGAASAASSAG